jgi:catechol 2,3-dioxygenase-like lactoylglutathione lyase family enzyme
MVPVREVRFVLVVDDYEAAARLYRDVLGLEVLMDLEGQGGRGLILKLPVATFEVVDPAHDRFVDEIEVGAPQHNRVRIAHNRVRIALEVDDLGVASEAVARAGAEPLAEPVETPWGDRNQRFLVKDGLQLTLFQAS